MHGKLLLQGVDQFTALIVQWTFSTEMMVVVCYLKQPLVWNVSSASDILEEWHDVARLLRPAERYKENCVIRGRLFSSHPLTRLDCPGLGHACLRLGRVRSGGVLLF